MSDAQRRVMPVVGALALVASGPVRESFDTTQLPKELLLLGLAAWSLWRARTVRAFDWLDGALALLAATTLVSAAAAESVAFAWRPTVLVLASATLALGLRSSDERLEWLRWLGFASVVLAVLGLVEVLGWSHWSLPGRAPSSLVGQRNTLAHVLVLASPTVWVLGLESPTRRERLGWALAAVLLAAVVVSTRSRAAWLAGPVALAVFLAMHRDGRRWWLLVGVSFAVCLALSMPMVGWRSASPYADTFRRLVDSTSGSGAGRLEQWRQSLSLVPASPVWGSGPGNWFVVYGRWARDVVTNRFANSDWVALLVERGVIGVVAVILVGVFLVRRWRGAPGLVGGGALMGATLVALGVTSTFDAVLQLAPGALVVTVVFFSGIGREQRFGVPRFARVAVVGSALLAVLLIPVGLAFASRLYSTGDMTTFERLELAVRLDPTDTVTRLELLKALVSAQRCDEASRHVEQVERSLPWHAEAKAAVQGFRAFCRY